VVPVRTIEGRLAALKVGWPHPESAHEHLALRAWNGAGAVRLWRADPGRGALLLERADPTRELASLSVFAACETIAALYTPLHRAALPQLPRLSELASEWMESLEGLHRHPMVPRRLVVQTLATVRDLANERDCDDVLLHADLHDANVLAALPTDQTPDAPERGWLAIDPKPIAGDPHLEPAPLLWNRWSEVMGAINARAALRSRLALVADVAGLDKDKTRGWCLVRVMMNIAWALQDDPIDSEWVTKNTIVAKALAS
jgi:streptomycin 6-kinase